MTIFWAPALMSSSKSVTLDDHLRTHIRRKLKHFPWQEFDDPGLRHAAVALVITTIPGSFDNPSILLTRRPARLNQHSGQYALPGGKLDPGETVFTAARRELEEELGLSLDESAILGRLDDYPTRSGFKITPVVLWAGAEARLLPSSEEVAEVFHIPFEELDSDALPIYEQGEDNDRPVLCSEFPTLGHRMYSPTAAVMYQFREVAIRGLHTKVAHYDQPRFAWK